MYYYRTNNGREVDFIWLDRERKKHFAQVCWTMKDDKTRQREISSLLIAMEEQQAESAIIVTHDENEILQEGNRKIEILPAWKFLLEAVSSQCCVSACSPSEAETPPDKPSNP